MGNAVVLRLTEPRSGRKPGHDAVGAQLDLPDFFENLAGNHENYFGNEMISFDCAPKT